MNDEKIIVLLRKCGHYLHHSAAGKNVDNALLTAALSEEEKETLGVILQKCLDSWQDLPQQKADK